jgi:hypothetical protein
MNNGEIMTTTTNKTEIKVTGKIPVKCANIIIQHEDIVTIELELSSDSVTVAAFGDGNTPSVMLTHDKFSAPIDHNQKNELTRVGFEELKGYKVWSCEHIGEILKICLTKDYF